MDRYFFLFCRHLSTMNGLKRISGEDKDGNLVKTSIPTSEIFSDDVIYSSVPIFTGNNVPKRAALNVNPHGFMGSRLLINEATAAFCSIPCVAIDEKEAQRFLASEGNK